METPRNFLTLGQAAKATDKAKGTISKAIKSGKLSVAIKEGNSYKIDPAELFRVFPAPVEEETKKNVSSEQMETQGELLRNRELELRLEHALELLRKEEENHAETKAEKTRLLTALENQMRLLVHMKEETTQKPSEKPAEGRRGFWDALLRRKA